MIGCCLVMASLAVTNMPPPYYGVYADAVGAALPEQLEILALPLRENMRGNTTYVNTRRYLLGPDNPNFMMTPDGSGLGQRGRIDISALTLQARTTENAAESARCLALAQWLLRSASPDRPSPYSSPRVELHARAVEAIAAARPMPHPRVFATAADFAALKARSEKDALLRSGIGRAIAAADGLIGRPTAVYGLDDYRLLGVARQSMRRILLEAFAWRMTGERRYAADALAEMKALCAFPDWNPRHTIDQGELALAVATGYDWTYDALSAADREEVAAALEKHALRAAVPFAGWTRLQNNWVQVVAAGLTASAVALADRDPALCADHLAAIAECLPEAESVCGPDGVYTEGPGYWNYGMSFNVICLDVMNKAFGHDFGLSRVKGFMETGLYPALVTGPSGEWFNYSDCSGTRGSSPAVWWYARRLGMTAAVTEDEVAAFRDICDGRAKELPRTFPFILFWVGEDLVRKAEKLPEVWVGLGEMPVAVLSADRTDRDAPYLAVKGGSPSYNHGHADAGSFVLDILGVRWAFDFGAENYGRVEKAHTDYQMGLLYFIANDPKVPADVREAMSKWGLAKDEFVDNGGWPYEIYVREGRRMVGEYTMTEHDCLGDPRHPAQGKAYGPVGMGSYSLDSHNVRRYVTAEGYVQNEGDIEVRPKTPYGVDYGAIVPRKADCENLLVPVALSATHMAFGSIRMEPVFMLLGESAATAAAFAARDGRAVQDVDYAELAERLRADGQILDLPVDAVNPFVGTSGSGHTTPAACRPFALVQAGPDTGVLDWKYCSGYQFADTELLGFSSSHISGSGCTDLGDVLLLPFTRAAVKPNEKLPMDKSAEVAAPGYYSIVLPTEGVKAEMTATKRVGYYRFAYPADKVQKLMVDLQYGIVVFGENGMTNRVLACDAKVLPDLTGVEAALQVKCWTTRRSFETVRFSRPATRVTELPKADPCEKAPRYVFEFAPSAEPLEVKVALSTTGTEGAWKNMATELPKWDFQAVRREARAEWNRLLSRMKMKGDAKQRSLFYTSLYHAAVGPHDITDVDGAYRGADDRIHAGVHYGEMSLWDTYRASHPFYTLVYPELVDGFVKSMVAQSREQGYLPIWPLRGQETDCMIGNPAVSVIADAYLKGFRGFDAEAAWVEIVKSLENPRPNSRVDLANRYGYFPLDLVKVESAAMTLEDAINCDGAAKLAAALGKTKEAAHYAKRAQNYRNLFDSETGFIRGRGTDGSWRTPFDPLRICNAYAFGGDFTEGNAWQYLWLVPHDVDGLVRLLGGREKFLAKLDELFALPSEPEGQPKLLDVTGLIGQYAHGNEPSQHIAFLYALAGRPARTQELVREVCDRFYTLEPDGVCGNEDNGQMSTWYLFAAMGFYPVDPAKGEYVLGAPQVPEVTIDLSNQTVKQSRRSNSLRIVANGLSEKNRYVKSVTWNGKPLTGLTVRHSDLVAGGELVFEMTDNR